jgi:hypothetical protein
LRLAIISGVEYLLAIVAALRHVVRQAWNDDASTSGHDQKLAEAACTLIENAPVPFYVFDANAISLWVALVLSLTTARIVNASKITEVTARQRVFEYVRSHLSLGSDHFLRGSRREDLEDDLFATQGKVRGQIHKAAFLFEVTETGYEIRSPEEAIFHSSVDGTGRWYVAVDALSGGLYGLGGFDQAEQDFNRLASDAKIFLASEETVRNWATFYLTVVVGKSLGVFITRQADLERQVEDIAEAYNSSRKQPFAPRRWLQDLEKSGIRPHVGVRVCPENGGFQVQVDTVATSGDRMPVLQRLRFDVSSRGIITGRSLAKLFPRSPGTRQ